MAELVRIDMLIQSAVARARQCRERDHELPGLLISEQEVENLLARSPGLPVWAGETFPTESIAVQHASERAAKRVSEAATDAEQGGRKPRLRVLAETFGLNPFEVEVLLVCVAGEIDLRYEKLFAYLQDDLTRKRPTVDLVLNLVARSLDEKLELRSHLSEAAPLRRHRLISFHDDTSYSQGSLLSHAIAVERRVVEYLLNSNALDPAIEPYCRIVSPGFATEAEAKIADDLVRFARSEQAPKGGLVAYLRLPDGPGVIGAVASRLQAERLRVLAVRADQLVGLDAKELRDVLPLVAREAALQDAILLVENMQAMADTRESRAGDQVLALLADAQWLTLASGEDAWHPPPGKLTSRLLHLAVPRPTLAERTAAWTTALAGLSAESSATVLASRFRLNPTLAWDAVSAAKLHALWLKGEEAVALADVETACRARGERRLGGLARKIEPRHRWEDIVLAPNREQLLRDICNAVRFRPLVHEAWGFDRKLSLARGLNVLFAGPPGTGKTFAAEVLANELGLDVYKVDLSSIVSKYIGETEKNLSRVFLECSTSDAILFFDEADALFGKRSEVRDSHDRYANVEVAYLLQKIEEYEGLVILATNFRKNMDDAFVRRLHFTVDFPLPSEIERRRMWERIWPPEAPLGPDVDPQILATSFEVTGGSIRNIALTAAFLAAEDGVPISMGHLTRASRRESLKMGQVEFAPKERSLTGSAKRK